MSTSPSIPSLRALSSPSIPSLRSLTAPTLPAIDAITSRFDEPTAFPARTLLAIVSPLLALAGLVLFSLSGMGRELVMWMPSLAMGVTIGLGILGATGIAAAIIVAGLQVQEK